MNYFGIFINIFSTINLAVLKLICNNYISTIIGLLTASVPIIVFVAGYILDYEYDVENACLYNDFNITCSLIYVVLAFVLLLIKPLLKFCICLDLIVSWLIIILTVVIIVNLIHILVETYNIMNKSEFFNEKVDKYIKEFIDNNENKNDKIMKEIQNFNQKQHENNSYRLINDDDVIDKTYKSIILKENQLVVGVKRRIYADINDNLKIIINDVIGKYCRKGDVLGYCPEDISFSSADDIFIFYKKYIPKYEAYSSIFKYVFKNGSVKFNVDDYKAVELFRYFCEKRYLDAGDLFCKEVLKIYDKNKKDAEYMEEFIEFVNHIKDIARKNNITNFYQSLEDIETSYVLKLIENNGKYQRYIRSFFTGSLYVLNESDTKVYDIVLSNLLLIIYSLLKKKKFDEVNSILNRLQVCFYYDHNKEVKLIKLGFIVGLVNGIFSMYFNGLCDECELTKMVKFLDKFSDVIDYSSLIKDYLFIINHKYNTMDVCKSSFLYLNDHQIEDLIIYDNLDQTIVLVLLLDVMGTYIENSIEVDVEKDNKNDMYIFKRMKDIIKENRIIKDKKEYKLVSLSKKKEFIDEIDRIINKYDELYNKYIETNKIYQKTINTFIRRLNAINIPNIKLLSILDKNELIKYDDIEGYTEIERTCLISREFFFDDDYSLIQLSNYINLFYYEVITNYYCSYINLHKDEYSKKNNQTDIIFMNDEAYNHYLLDKDYKYDMSRCILSNYIMGKIIVPEIVLPTVYINKVNDKNVFAKNKTIFFYDLSKDDAKRNELLESRKFTEDELKRKMLIVIKVLFKIALL